MGYSNPCHPEDLYPIALDTSSSEETTGSRYRIYFPWEHEGKTADKFRVTASWPCISPSAVYASGNYAFWDLYGIEHILEQFRDQYGMVMTAKMNMVI